MLALKDHFIKAQGNRRAVGRRREVECIYVYVSQAPVTDDEALKLLC